MISLSGARLVNIPPAAPLGAFPYGSCPEHEFSLSERETLMLYTDGLVDVEASPSAMGSTSSSLRSGAR